MTGSVTFSRELIYKCGEFADVTIYPCKVKRRQRRRLGKPTREAQAWVNDVQARNRFIRLVNTNFDQRDLYVTLTFDEANLPGTREETRKICNNFLRRLKYAVKKKHLPADREFRTLYVIEGEDGHRLHLHILMTGLLTREEVESRWNMGYCNTKQLQPDGQGFAALATYLTKQGRLKDAHRWYGSRNLKQPEKKERNGQVGVETVNAMGRFIEAMPSAAMGLTTEEWASDIESKYPGYYLAGAKSKYNEVDGRWYIHIKLFRKDGYVGKQEAWRRRMEKRNMERLAGGSLLSCHGKGF